MEIQYITFSGHARRSTKAIQCALKTCFKEGLFGDKVKYGIYGNKLTRKVVNGRVYTNVSAEHVIPASKGGDLIALATQSANKQKKNKNIWEVLNNRTEAGRNKIIAAGNYLKQFTGIRINTIDSKGKHIVFDGDEYIRKFTAVLRKVGIVPGNPDADIKLKNVKPVKTRTNHSYQRRR